MIDFCDPSNHAWPIAACLQSFVDGALSIWHLASSYSILLLNRIIAFFLEGAAELS
jgi:hypothetical protein